MDEQMKNHGAQMQVLLDLKMPAVAIGFLDSAPTDIARVAAPSPAGCGYWKLAAEGSVFYTDASDHYGCPVGAYTHGVIMPQEVAKELDGLVRTMVEMQYLSTTEIPMIPHRKQPFGVAVYGPLERVGFTPDVVVIRGTVKQLMLLAEAAHSTGVGCGAAMGRPACAMLPESLQSQRATFSFGCIGNRIYTGLGDDEGYYAIPYVKLAAVVNRLAVIIEANRQLGSFHRARAGDAAPIAR